MRGQKCDGMMEIKVNIHPGSRRGWSMYEIEQCHQLRHYGCSACELQDGKTDAQKGLTGRGTGQWKVTEDSESRVCCAHYFSHYPRSRAGYKPV